MDERSKHSGEATGSPHAAEDFALLERAELALRMEADALLDKAGLRAILSRHGRPFVQGSYALRLMTWRDLDIYLDVDRLSAASFFAMGGQIAEALKPIRMSFRNNRIERDPELPDGLYWGIRLPPVGPEGWKIDIWALDAGVCEEKKVFHQHLSELITAQSREPILRIKTQFCHHPEYRKRLTSMTIYQAVLEGGVSDAEGFRQYVRQQGLGVDL